jgi:hypothetical protein
MPDPTPGQTAYETYFQALYATIPTSSDVWTWQTPAVQRAWEAAAQAVLDADLAARVWARQAPSSRWQVVPPPQEDTP